MVKLKGKVKTFLEEFKGIAQKDRIYIIHREKNIQDLIRLGLTKKNCSDEIMALSVNDYCKGPEPDNDQPGEIWIFGKEINGKEIYIKLKIAKVGGKQIAKCISFHIKSFPLCYPLKGKI